MGLSLFPPEPKAEAAPACPGAREQHIQCALLHVAHGATAADAARVFRVSPRTVRYWTARAMTYDDPRAEYVRMLAGRAS